ncbi:MAG: cell division protein FtsA [Candidatus Omnitrophica bacterium]|nr:cell division protein FtsA [Candidatus Omnitrophota bacterium]
MRKMRVITGLDIGSSKTSAVAAGVDASGDLVVLTHASGPSNGISRGAIVNINEAVNSASAVLNKLRDKVPAGLGDIYVNINDETVKGSSSKGMIALSLRGREVTKLDMEKCVDVAGTIHLPMEREIIHRIVHKFSVDDQPSIKNPLGLYASRLSCEVYVVTADANHIQNIFKCVNNSGYSVKDIIFTGVAEGQCLLDKDEKEDGVALVDIGDSLTDIWIFFEGSMRRFDIIPLGARDFKGDFKENSKFVEMKSRLNTSIKDFVNSGGKVSSVVLTGGMSFTENLAESLEEVLSLSVKMGVAKGIRGDITSAESVRLSGAIGLVKCGLERYAGKAFASKRFVRNLSERVVDIFNNYF